MVNINDLLLCKLCKLYDADADIALEWALYGSDNSFKLPFDECDTPESVATFIINYHVCEIMIGDNDDPAWHGTDKKHYLALILDDDWVLDHFWFDDDIDQETFDIFRSTINDYYHGKPVKKMEGPLEERRKIC